MISHVWVWKVCPHSCTRMFKSKYIHTYGKDKAMVEKKGHNLTGVNQGRELQECSKGRRLEEVRGSTLKDKKGGLFVDLEEILFNCFLLMSKEMAAQVEGSDIFKTRS